MKLAAILAMLVLFGAGCPKCLEGHTEQRYRQPYVTYPYMGMKGSMRYMPQYNPGYYYDVDVCDKYEKTN